MKPSEFDAVWNAIKSRLEELQSQTFEAIKNYPSPITACDQQFDQLLAQREQLSQEIRRVTELSETSSADGEAAKSIEDFIRSSKWIDESIRH